MIKSTITIEMNAADRAVISRLIDKELATIKNFRDNPRDPRWENYRNHLKEINKKIN